MSTQINQYLMYGISIPYPKDANFSDKYERFQEDSAFNADIPDHHGIFCLMDGMNGGYVIIGKVLAKSDNHERIADDKPLRIDTLTLAEKLNIAAIIHKHFGEDIDNSITPDYYFITHYR